VDETYYVGLRVVLLARWRPVTLPSAHAHVPLSSNTPYFPRSTSPEVGAAHRERGIRHVDDDTLPTHPLDVAAAGAEAARRVGDDVG
jgi:hypothetical protein